MFFRAPSVPGLRRRPKGAPTLLCKFAYILAVSLFAVGHVAAEHLAADDYPDMGNVQQGCAGATQCIIYLSGGGTVTTAGIQNDLKILTAGLPPGVGLIAHRPSDYLGNLYVYSSSDIENLKGDAGAYSPQFGSRLVTVGVSDGVRAMRSAAGSYGQEAGIWIEIDQFSPFPLTVPALDTTRTFQVVTSYSTSWPGGFQSVFNTGPSSYTGPSDRYSIILNTAGLLGMYADVLPALQFPGDLRAYDRWIVRARQSSSSSILSVEMKLELDDGSTRSTFLSLGSSWTQLEIPVSRFGNWDAVGAHIERVVLAVTSPPGALTLDIDRLSLRRKDLPFTDGFESGGADFWSSKSP